jgi:flagellar hook-associated protein 2
MGLVSGGVNLDTGSIIDKLMTLEQRPLTLLATKETGLQAKISAFGAVKGALSALQSAAEALGKPDIFAARKATIADDKVATVASSAGAVAGNFSMEVSSLARAQVVASTGFSGGTAVVGSGTLTIALGKYDGGTFTAAAGKSPVNITIDADKSSLADVRDAINKAEAGVTASLVNDGSGTRLVVSSNEGGTAHAVRITAADDDGNDTDAAGLSRLTYDASTGGTSNLTETLGARDAALVLNGIAITSGSNTLTDAIEGVTINLKATNVGNPTTIAVTQDYNQPRQAIEQFVKSYNDTISLIKKQTAYDAEKKQASTLTGENTMRALRSQLSAIATSEIAPGLSLSAIGVTVQSDGTLAIDAANKWTSAPKLATALENGKAERLFVGSDGLKGLSARMDAVIDGLIEDKTGLLSARTDSLSKSVKLIDTQREALNTRLLQIQERYTKQFAALDTLLGKMNGTSNYLAQQLANLPGAAS